MNGKIALEEHISPNWQATESPIFVDGSYFKDVEHRLQEYKVRMEDMDATGIETAILSLTAPAGIEWITDTRKAIDTARKMNDHLANFFVKTNPGRFLGFACVPLQDPAAAAKELERAIKQLGFVGVLINGYTNIGDENTARYLDEAPVWEFWEAVHNLDVPVYLHPRLPLPNQRRIYQGYEGLLGSAWGFGVETGTHALRLMLSGLFDRFPKLNIILGHLGEGLSFTLPRVEHRLRHLARGSHGKHERAPMDYLRENFYLTTSGTFRSQALLNTMLEISTDRLLFSVDYPYESMREIAPWFDNCPIGENDRLKLGRTNAEKLFKLRRGASGIIERAA